MVATDVCVTMSNACSLLVAGDSIHFGKALLVLLWRASVIPARQRHAISNAENTVLTKTKGHAKQHIDTVTVRELDLSPFQAHA